MKKVTLFIFLFSLTAVYAQYDVNVVNATNLNATSTGMWIVQNEAKQEIKGDLYLYDGNLPTGIVTVKGGKKYKIKNLNYNIKDNRLEAKITPDSVYALDPGNIVQVDFGDVKLRTLMDSKKYALTFYEVIGSTDQKSLLKQYKIKLVHGAVNPMTQQKVSPDKFVRDAEYYLLEKGGKIEEFKLKKKSVLRLFNTKSDQVADYVKEYDLSFKNDEDLKLLFKKYTNI